MRATIVPTQDCPESPECAVVVDVLRAFTVTAVCLGRGVQQFVLAETLESALTLKAGIPGALALKDGEPDEGFKLP